MRAAVRDPVRHTLRRHEQVAGAHWQRGPLEKEEPLALEDVVELVHARMAVQSVRLPRLERIEPNEQPGRLIHRGLAHLVGSPDRMVGWRNHGGVCHLPMLPEAACGWRSALREGAWARIMAPFVPPCQEVE